MTDSTHKSLFARYGDKVKCLETAEGKFQKDKVYRVTRITSRILGLVGDNNIFYSLNELPTTFTVVEVWT